MAWVKVEVCHLLHLESCFDVVFLVVESCTPNPRFLSSRSQWFLPRESVFLALAADVPTIWGLTTVSLRMRQGGTPRQLSSECASCFGVFGLLCQRPTIAPESEARACQLHGLSGPRWASLLLLRRESSKPLARFAHRVTVPAVFLGTFSSRHSTWSCMLLTHPEPASSGQLQCIAIHTIH